MAINALKYMDFYFVSYRTLEKMARGLRCLYVTGLLFSAILVSSAFKDTCPQPNFAAPSICGSCNWDPSNPTFKMLWYA